MVLSSTERTVIADLVADVRRYQQALPVASRWRPVFGRIAIILERVLLDRPMVDEPPGSGPRVFLRRRPRGGCS